MLLPNKRRQQLEAAMREASSYRQWSKAAKAHDLLTGMALWRNTDKTRHYDYSSIRQRLDRLRDLRERKDHSGLLFTLNEGVHGNMGGMGKTAVHERARYGTKRLIEEYVAEIAGSLQQIAELDETEISVEEKLDFFNRASQCYGHSALMLSGGGALGFYHVGVVKSLLEQNLLPSVISGASAGSLVAAIVGTHSDSELQKFFDPGHIRFEAQKEARWFNRFFWSKNAPIDINDLVAVIERLIPDMTFEEAYKKTGRHISISIAPAEVHQTSRLLNAITSPNVFIRSAVMASCAVPGVFPAVTLRAKNLHGKSQPYLASRRWVDGSISDDLPAKRLARLYGVNHFIVSQVNPLVLPFVSGSERQQRLMSTALGIGRGALSEGLKLQRSLSQRYMRDMPRVNLLFNSAYSLINQKYSGDVNIVPSFRFYDVRKVLSKISEEELVELIKEGERAAWPHIETIRTCTLISQKLEEVLEKFHYLEIQAMKETRASFSSLLHRSKKSRA